MAREVARYFKTFFKVKKEWRRVNDRELPVVFVDFEEWITFYSIRGNQLHPLDTIALKKLRLENNLRKSDENDAILLLKVQRSCFKQLTVKEVNLLQLIEEYRRYVKWRQKILCWMKIQPLHSFRECVREINKYVRNNSRRIIEEVLGDEKYREMYKMVCEAVGVKNSIDIAILIVRLPFHWKLSKLKGLLGLIPYNHKNYNHRIRADFSNIATNIYLNNKRSKNKSKVSKELEDILNLPYRKAVYLLQIRILKMLKKAYPLVSQKAEPTGPMSSKSCEASGF